MTTTENVQDSSHVAEVSCNASLASAICICALVISAKLQFIPMDWFVPECKQHESFKLQHGGHSTILLSECICGLRMIIATNSNYFRKKN
jgi:hypothetical protein